MLNNNKFLTKSKKNTVYQFVHQKISEIDEGVWKVVKGFMAVIFVVLGFEVFFDFFDFFDLKQPTAVIT